jgi:protein-tyrosine phosphatase
LRSGLRGQDEITIESAGLAALVDHPAAEHAVELMSERGKVHRLGEWRDMEISDPYQQPKAAFAETLQDIEDGVADWVTRLAT